MSNDKIVSINAGVKLSQESGKGVADPKFVEIVEKLLADVKSGEVTSLYATGFCQDGSIFRGSWFGDDGQFDTIGIIEAMKHHFLDVMNKGYSE